MSEASHMEAATLFLGGGGNKRNTGFCRRKSNMTGIQKRSRTSFLSETCSVFRTKNRPINNPRVDYMSIMFGRLAKSI